MSHLLFFSKAECFLLNQQISAVPFSIWILCVSASLQAVPLCSSFCNIGLIWGTCFSQIHTCTVQGRGTHSDPICTVYMPWFVSGPDLADCSHALGQKVKHYLIVWIPNFWLCIIKKCDIINKVLINYLFGVCVCVCVCVCMCVCSPYMGCPLSRIVSIRQNTPCFMALW